MIWSNRSLSKAGEQLQFASFFTRDVPQYNTWFVDADQIYDPIVYLGYLTAHPPDTPPFIACCQSSSIRGPDLW